MHAERLVMGDGARGEFEKKPKRDDRRLSDLIAPGTFLVGNDDALRTLQPWSSC